MPLQLVCTTDSAVLSAFVFIFSSTAVHSFLSVLPETKRCLLSFIFIASQLYNRTRTHRVFMSNLTGSVKPVLARSDVQPAPPVHPRAGLSARRWRCCHQSFFLFLWSAKSPQEIPSQWVFSWQPTLHTGSPRVWVCGSLLHICSLFITTPPIVSVFLLAFSPQVFTVKVQNIFKTFYSLFGLLKSIFAWTHNLLMCCLNWRPACFSHRGILPINFHLRGENPAEVVPAPVSWYLEIRGNAVSNLIWSSRLHTARCRNDYIREQLRAMRKLFPECIIIWY